MFTFLFYPLVDGVFFHAVLPEFGKRVVEVVPWLTGLVCGDRLRSRGHWEDLPTPSLRLRLNFFFLTPSRRHLSLHHVA